MKSLLERLNIPYQNELLYLTALTHASYGYENQTENNERLEFLGDAVMQLLMGDYLYRKENVDEGMMTKMRAQLVCKEAYVVYASHIHLKEYMRLGKGEQLKGANDSMIADAFEALFGAIYLDLGYMAAEKAFQIMVVPHIKPMTKIIDYKSSLQELIQSGDKRNISYTVIKESGPSHDKEYEVAVKLDNHIILGVGKGKKKKDAEQDAAHDALKKVNYDLKETL